MNTTLKKIYTSKLFLIGTIILILLFIAGIYQYRMLQIAHSSFDNYYRFRGCVSLVSKTDTDAVCRLASGQTIKLVEVNNKWFLDGDFGW